MSRLRGRAGYVRLEIRGAYPEAFLSRLAGQNIRFFDLRQLDELSIQISILVRDMDAVRQCAKKTMCEMHVLHIGGILPNLQRMGTRAVYPLLLLGLIMVVFWLQGHIWFLSVSGNTLIPSEQLLWTLEQHEIKFWTPTEDLDLNRIKNEILAELPELSWITINTEGGFAEVIVRERREKPVISRSSAPADVVAGKSGLITDVSVTGGSPMIQKGDIVRAGDLLISGVTDLEKTILVTRAQGEVFARTWNQTSAVLPGNLCRKSYTGREIARYSLTVGKKTINFYKTSGISYTEYDKIIHHKVLTLPGGYTFPISWTEIVYREYESVPAASEENEGLLEQAALRQLWADMTAGTVLNHQFAIEQTEQGVWLRGVSECQEEIGITKEMEN